MKHQDELRPDGVPVWLTTNRKNRFVCTLCGVVIALSSTPESCPLTWSTSSGLARHESSKGHQRRLAEMRERVQEEAYEREVAHAELAERMGWDYR